MLLRLYADILHNAPAPYFLFSRFDGCAACAVKMELPLDSDFRAHGLLHPGLLTHSTRPGSVSAECSRSAWEQRGRRREERAVAPPPRSHRDAYQ